MVAIGLALGIGVGSSALAATYTVSNLNDSGAGSLRDAVTQANATISVPDVVTFAPGVTGTIALASVISVTDQLSINGPGASLLTITPAAGAAGLSSTVPLAISGVTFAGGSGGPAAVISGGGLTLQSSAFSNNSGAGAGAVYFLYSSVSISDCTFNNNTGTGSAYAGAVAGGLGPLSVTRSTFNGNQGVQAGAIYSINNTFVMTDSTVSGNTGGTQAGGIALASNFSTALVSQISNSTVSGNVATNASAGGILVTQTGSGSSTLNLTSTIVANSTSNPGTVDIDRVGAGVTVNAANSLIKNGAGGINGSNTANIFGVDPLLGPLQNNGGPTKTQALLPGSPAIDTGSNPLVLATDQRGAGFARTVGSATDIGAYEVQAAPVPPVPTATSIPTLSEWGTLVLAALVGGATLFTGLGRRRRDG